jgi:hypothetical protein
MDEQAERSLVLTNDIEHVQTDALREAGLTELSKAHGLIERGVQCRTFEIMKPDHDGPHLPTSSRV